MNQAWFNSIIEALLTGSPELYSLHLSPEAWIAAGIALLAAIYILAMLMPRLSRIVRKSRHDSISVAEADGSADCPVSVIVIARTEAVCLNGLVERIFQQQYEAPLEVIVVNSEESSSVDDSLKQLQLRYPALRVTFSPAGSRSLSRRKLALTIGVKAASHPHVVITHGNCRIDSTLWLRAICRHFDGERRVVLGYATLRDSAEPDIPCGSRMAAFHDAIESARWIGSALGGHPVRGCGSNLAYDSELFFSHKGFSNSLGLSHGEDDVFVNEIAHGNNCAMELSEQSILRELDSWPQLTWRNDRYRRAFTSRRLPRTGYRLMGSISAAWWIWLATSVAAAVLSLPSMIGVAVSIVSCIALWWASAHAWGRLTSTLGLRRICGASLPLSLLHPLFNIGVKWHAWRESRSNYTWSDL